MEMVLKNHGHGVVTKPDGTQIIGTWEMGKLVK